MEQSQLNLNPLVNVMKDTANLLARKEVIPLFISGTTSNGTLSIDLVPPIQLNANATHIIYVKSFTTWSNIPNVITGKNDNFTYTNNSGVTKTIIIPQGTYEIDQINQYIQAQMQNNGDYNSSTTPVSYYVTISLNDPTYQVVITTSNSYKVDFTPASSIGSLLGFPNIQINPSGSATSATGSTKIINILPVQAINIICNIASGARLNGVPENLLYSFGFDVALGSLISEKPNPIMPVLCNSKTISTISLQFKDQNKNPVTFGGELITVLIVIEQL